MAQGNPGHRFSAQDAAFLYNESDNEPLNIGSVAVFEGDIPYEDFVNNLAAKMHLIPRYQQRAIPAPLNMNHPTWEWDPEFDIRKHVISVRLDPPGTDGQLRQLAAQIFQGMLGRDKPLWEIYLVHGLDQDRTAMVSKVHHCLVDGVSGIELLMVVLDVSRDPPPPSPPPEPRQFPPIPDSATRLVDALFDRMAESLRTAADTQKAILNAAANPAATRSLSRALETALPYFAVPDQRAPFNQRLSYERTYAWSHYDFAEVRAIRKASGATVNDVVLAMLGGALSRYYDAHGLPTDGRIARILTPVNVRREDERGALGNRVSMLLVEVPLGLRDPIERLAAVHKNTDKLKREHVADGIELVAEAIGSVPPMLQALFGSMPKPTNTVANMVCTNVPGPMIPLYSVGHRLIHHYPMVPLGWEMGIGCAVTSYNQKLYFGLMADAKAAPDVERFGDFLTESYVELRSAAGVTALELPSMERTPVERKPRRAAPTGESLAADAG